MRTAILVAVMLGGCAARPAREVAPKWTRDSRGFEVATCPARYYVYVDEGEAMRGEDAAHCVREVRP